MLALGSREQWQEAIAALTSGRERDFSTAALLEYFAPLQRWLERYNREHHVPVGWRTAHLPVHF